MPALTPAQKTQLEDVVEIFIDDILELESAYGHDLVLSALKRYKIFSALRALKDLTKDSLVFLIEQIQTLPSPGRQIKENILRESWVTAALTTLGFSAASKAYDQDVDIAAITTSDELPVKSPSLERILASTQQMIHDMTDTLSAALGEIDKSIDFLAATETGGTIASVQGAQAQDVAQSREPVELAQAKQQSKEK